LDGVDGRRHKDNFGLLVVHGYHLLPFIELASRIRFT
jgi:hypothetical protein